MSKLGVLVIALVASGCLNRTLSEDASFDHAAALKQATVYIAGCGTGFLVSDDLVVTNRHVLKCVREHFNGHAQVHFANGAAQHAMPVGSSEERFVDLAVLKLPRSGMSRATGVRAFLPLDPVGRVAPGDLLLSMGNPGPNTWIPTSFRVLAQPKTVDGGLDGVIVMEGSAYYGDSGSPVMTLGGKVVGVIYARAPGTAYAVPVQPYLTDLIREVDPAATVGGVY